MELLHLRTFVTVADTRSVTKAAERLFLTPPSISAHIKALEEELQVLLFVRAPKGMQLTTAGAILHVKAEQTLALAQDFLHQATHLRTQLTGRVALALNAPARLLRIGPVIAQLQQYHPGIEIACTTSVTGYIMEGLHAKSIDIGYVFGDVHDAAMTTIPLSCVELVVAVPKRWESQVRNACWTDLAKLPWITSTIYCPFQQILSQIFAQQRLTYQQIAQSDGSATTSELVHAGVGLALLEKSAAEAMQADNVIIVQVESMTCPLAVAYLTEREGDPIIQAVVATIDALWHDK